MTIQNERKTIAFLYDFDKTLSPRDMEEYSLIPRLGYDCPKDFWEEVGDLSKQNKMDSISAYLYLLQKKYEDAGNPLTEEAFTDLGKQIELFPGVETWFERINAYGEEKGFHIEHYIISSGMSEIIENTPIAEKFCKIYACRYFYDEQGYAKWPARLVNYTTKTQYIFRINKQVLDESNEKDVNEYLDPLQRPVPFERMLYIADGLTDVPCMRLVKEYGGKSIAVYNGKKDIAEKLYRDGRINFIAPSDYSENSIMENLVKKIIDHMAADEVLRDMEKANGKEAQ